MPAVLPCGCGNATERTCSGDSCWRGDFPWAGAPHGPMCHGWSPAVYLEGGFCLNFSVWSRDFGVPMQECEQEQKAMWAQEGVWAQEGGRRSTRWFGSGNRSRCRCGASPSLLKCLIAQVGSGVPLTSPSPQLLGAAIAQAGAGGAVGRVPGVGCLGSSIPSVGT